MYVSELTVCSSAEVVFRSYVILAAYYTAVTEAAHSVAAAHRCGYACSFERSYDRLVIPGFDCADLIAYVDGKPECLFLCNFSVSDLVALLMDVG